MKILQKISFLFIFLFLTTINVFAISSGLGTTSTSTNQNTNVNKEFFLVDVTVDSQKSVILTFNNDLYSNIGVFEFSLIDENNNDIKIVNKELVTSKSLRLTLEKSFTINKKYSVITMFAADSNKNTIEDGVNGSADFISNLGVADTGVENTNTTLTLNKDTFGSLTDIDYNSDKSLTLNNIDLVSNKSLVLKFNNKLLDTTDSFDFSITDKYNKKINISYIYPNPYPDNNSVKLILSEPLISNDYYKLSINFLADASNNVIELGTPISFQASYDISPLVLQSVIVNSEGNKGYIDFTKYIDSEKLNNSKILFKDIETNEEFVSEKVQGFEGNRISFTLNKKLNSSHQYYITVEGIIDVFGININKNKDGFTYYFYNQYDNSPILRVLNPIKFDKTITDIVSNINNTGTGVKAEIQNQLPKVINKDITEVNKTKIGETLFDEKNTQGKKQDNIKINETKLSLKVPKFEKKTIQNISTKIEGFGNKLLSNEKNINSKTEIEKTLNNLLLGLSYYETAKTNKAKLKYANLLIDKEIKNLLKYSSN